MYITINNKAYTTLLNLSFAPQTDVTGDAVPINEFSARIVTGDTISYGQYAELFNDINIRFAKYWIVYAESISPGVVQIVARSDIALLDNVTLSAVMYSEEPIKNVLDSIMVRQAGAGLVGTIEYTMASALNGVTITGFCPEQSARERLQWVCLAAGAYVRAFFGTKIRIAPIDSTATLIPIENTYKAQTITYKDYVTAVKITGYMLTQGTPSVTDEWVSDGTNTYIVTKQAYTLANPDAPSSAPDNVVEIDGVYLINATNVSSVLTYLSTMYFKRTEVDLEAVNNGSYIPGDKLIVYTGEDSLISGYANSMDFAFGLQSKSKITLVAADTVAGATLTVTYKYGTTILSMKKYVLPVGYTYTIDNPYIDKIMDNHRYVFRPTTATVTGTMASGGSTETVQYAVALDLYEDVLQVISVDDITTTTEGGKTVGVIA